MGPQDLILVTGASGMVGVALMKHLRQEGFERCLTPGSKELDIRRQDQVVNYLSQHRPKYVFHLAGHIGGIKASITRPVEFMYENLIMGMNIIHGAHASGIQRLLFVGSSCIYPRECPQPMREEHILSGALEPTNEGYAIAKIAGIKLCEYLNAQHGRDFISLIPCNIYGLHDNFANEDSHVISALMRRMHEAKVQGVSKIEVWGSGNTRREFIYVDDFADAMIYFMKNWHLTRRADAGGSGGAGGDAGGSGAVLSPERPWLNTGSGVDQSVRELAFAIRDVVGYEGDLVFNSDKPDGMPKKLMDVSRANQLGWRAKTDLMTGLRETYAWYQEWLRGEQ